MAKRNNNRRSQTRKPRRWGVENHEYVEAMQNLRRSNATTPVPAGDSDREPKHRQARGLNWLDND